LRKRSARWAMVAATALLAALAFPTASGCGSTAAPPPRADAALAADTNAMADQGAPPDTAFDSGACPAIALVSFGGPTCEDCTGARCCVSATSCYAPTKDAGVTACALLANCISICNGSAGDAGGPVAPCVDGCNSQYAAGMSPYATLLSCIDRECRTDAGTGPCDP